MIKYITACLAAATCMLIPAQAQIWSEEFNSGSAPDDEVWSSDPGHESPRESGV